MAISVNWGTGVISVPKADLTQITPTLFEQDANVFRLALKDLEDDATGGMASLKTNDHNTEVLLSGVTYARIIEILAPYTIEWEDGQYAVRIVGANHNFADVKVLNQVSLVIGNSAGLITVVSGSGLSAGQDTKLDELHKLQGLDISNPMTATPISRDAGASVSQTISGDGSTTTTVTRDP